MHEFLNKDFTYAVLGASNNSEKYGYKVTKQLLDLGYTVIPINPHEQSILDQEVFATLQDVPVKIDVVVFVVPPLVTELALQSVQELGIARVWMQPGSESDVAIEFCKDNDIAFIARSCIVVRAQ